MIEGGCVSAGLGIPLRSLRSASPFVARKGRVAFVESGERTFAAWFCLTAASFRPSDQLVISSRLPLSSVAQSRLSDSLLKVRSGFHRPLGILVLSVASIMAIFVVAGCSGNDEPTAAPTSIPPAATVAPTPEPAEATATPDMSSEAAGENGDEITREDVLATVFEDWGSTCLNNAYPPSAPQLDDVSCRRSFDRSEWA